MTSINLKERYVGRGAIKLKYALEQFEIEVKGKVAADLGCSTGGFTEILLEQGVRKVYAVDTAYGQLDWKLRNDARVVVMERVNAMHTVLPEHVDLITIDTGWTKQKNILPNAFKNLVPGGNIISLIKPHYEAGKAKLDERQVVLVVDKVKKDIQELGGKIRKLIKSPILGEKGKNSEFLALISN